MVLIDTSAWIKFLRDTGSPACRQVDELLDHEIAICDPIRMEVLAGARDEAHLLNLRRLLARAVVLPTRPTDYEDAAALYRRCRRQGATVRKLIDCLIAAVAIRSGTPILHHDTDYQTLARHTTLQTHTD
ncbi:MAG: PIN domain nuclease [Chloroflexota bacterium]|nr:PIN domain nuclease [Chloroflexota bacterium]